MNTNIYNQIKDKFIDIEVNKKVTERVNNRYDLSKYYEIGELIIEAQGGEEKAKYGDKIIKELSIKLTNELGKGYSTRLLERTRKYFLFQKSSTLSPILSWSHYIELLSLDDYNEIEYYINESVMHNYSVRKLRSVIKYKEYQRLPDTAINKLKNNEELSILDQVKDPIIIKSSSLDTEKITEKAIHIEILRDINCFLSQLGEGYCYVNTEYPIRIGNKYNYIDILLFNIKYNCYVVVELKVTELKKEYIGQIQIYMNYIDQNVKSFIHDKTIGLIISKKNNEFIIKYSSDKRIKSVEWIIN